MRVGRRLLVGWSRMGGALVMAIVAAAVPLGAGAATPETAAAPATAGDHVMATFTGSIRGIVLLSELPDGAVRVAVTLNGAPSGRMRLVGSSAPCTTKLAPGNRSFSLTYQKIEWVRATVPNLMEEEGIWYYIRSIRLVRPGPPARQVACRPVAALLRPDPAVVFTDVLISSYSVADRSRGMIVLGPTTDDGFRIRGVFQRLRPGVTYRLIGSRETCGASHQAAETVFDLKVPRGGWVNSIAESGVLLDWIQGIRVLRGASGYGTADVCLQDQIERLTAPA